MAAPPFSPSPELIERYGLPQSPEWQKLLTHLDFAEGRFSFILVLVLDSSGAEICRQSLDAFLQYRRQSLASRLCTTPDELTAVLRDPLLHQSIPQDPPLAAIWISAVGREETFETAWLEVASRLNESRDTLRRTLPLPLILVGPPWLQPLLRDHAPDLWSARDLVAAIEPARGPLESSTPSLSFDEPPPVTDPAEDYRQAERLRESGGDPNLRATLLVRAAYGLLQRGELIRASTALSEARLLAHAQDDPLFLFAVNLACGDIAMLRGDYDEALRIYREECLAYLPADEELLRAIAFGKIADVFASRGELDETLRLLREALPIFEKLGDLRHRAVALGKVADVFTSRGDLEDALLLLEREVLPVFGNLGDLRSRAVTLGQIAGIFEARGDLDNAIRLIQHEELPVYEKLGDRRSRAIAKASLASLYVRRNQAGDLDRARPLLRDALAIAEEMRLREAAQIRAFLEQLSGT